MKNISFSLTTPQILARSKTVTRRLGWKTLAVGTRLQGVEKAMGLKPGEKVKKLAVIEVVSASRERLNRMTMSQSYGADEVVKEGFPGKTPAEFVSMFCEHMKVAPEETVTRIEFKYVE